MFIPNDIFIFRQLNKRINKVVKVPRITNPCLCLRENTEKVDMVYSFYDKHLLILNKRGILCVNDLDTVSDVSQR